MSPHEGLRPSYGTGLDNARGGPRAAVSISMDPREGITSSAEDSHSGLVRTLGKRVE